MIRKAEMSDLESIMEIVPEIIKEMHLSNNYQWDANYPQVKDFTQDITNGNLYVSVKDNRVVGFICINDDEPQEYNELKWSSSEDALVIHRMGVSSDFRKVGIGAELVRFADELSRSLGVNCLKTDTYSLNTKAQGLFEGKEKPFYCYEKVLEA
jgi:ribosomal protein S18 acetylase RimI-like enzyme